MASCPYCNADLPGDAVFCLECGVRLKEAAPPAPPEPKAVEPVQAPERRAAPAPPQAICRFCKGALNLQAEFCEYCGAPLEEAAPPGLLKPKPAPGPLMSAAPRLTPPVSVPAPEVPKAVPAPPKPVPSVPPPAASPRLSPIPAVQVPKAAPAPSKPVPSVPPAAAPARPLPIPPMEVPKAAPAPPKPVPSVPPAVAPARPVSTRTPEVPRTVPPPYQAAPAIPTAPPPATPVSRPQPEAPRPAIRIPPPPRLVSVSPPGMPKAAEPARVVPPPAPPPAAAPPIPTAAPAPVEVPVAEPGPTEFFAPEAPEAGAPPKRAFPVAIVILGAGLMILVAGAGAWYWHRSRVKPLPPSTQVAAPTPSVSLPAQPEAAPTPAPTDSPAPTEVSATVQPKKTRAAKPTPAPPPPETAAPNPQAIDVARLRNLAREAYIRGEYAQPAESCAINYAKGVLALAPNDDYAKTILENSVNGGKYQAQQAIQAKDFATAHRVANALAQLLPGRNDIKELQKDVDLAEKADEAAHRPPPAPVAAVSFRAYHMHSEKAPADKGPYCLGTLSVVGSQVRFAGESASDSQVHKLEFACAEVREIKKNARVAARQGGFHIRTSSNTNFAPQDSSPAHVSALAAACSK